MHGFREEELGHIGESFFDLIMCLNCDHRQSEINRYLVFANGTPHSAVVHCFTRWSGQQNVRNKQNVRNMMSNELCKSLDHDKFLKKFDQRLFTFIVSLFSVVWTINCVLLCNL